jgi:hypothetical protein
VWTLPPAAAVTAAAVTATVTAAAAATTTTEPLEIKRSVAQSLAELKLWDFSIVHIGNAINGGEIVIND